MILANLVRNLLETRPIELYQESYVDFHIKGLDYVCLQRTQRMTVKVYVFGDKVPLNVELIKPHDHAYSFHSEVIQGGVRNHLYEVGGDKQVKSWYWGSPLNGKPGMVEGFPCSLRCTDETLYGPGEGYWMESSQIHTISVTGPNTILALVQMHDVKTASLCFSSEKPECSSRYKKMPMPRYADLCREVIKSAVNGRVNP